MGACAWGIICLVEFPLDLFFWIQEKSYSVDSWLTICNPYITGVHPKNNWVKWLNWSNRPEEYGTQSASDEKFGWGSTLFIQMNNMGVGALATVKQNCQAKLSSKTALLTHNGSVHCKSSEHLETSRKNRPLISIDFHWAILAVDFSIFQRISWGFLGLCCIAVQTSPGRTLDDAGHRATSGSQDRSPGGEQRHRDVSWDHWKGIWIGIIHRFFENSYIARNIVIRFL